MSHNLAIVAGDKVALPASRPGQPVAWQLNWSNGASNADGGTTDKRSTLPLLDLAALAETRPEPRTFALDKFIPQGELTLFTGPGGSSKSLLAQQLATCIAVGRPFLGLGAMHGPALYVTAEDDERELHWRQDHIARRLGVPFAAPGLHLASLRGRLGNELCTFDNEGRLKPSETFKVLGATIDVTGAQFVALDNVAHVFTASENDRAQVTQFANLLNRLAGETGATILLVAHPAKTEGSTYSGSTAWLNAVRSHIVLDLRRDSDGSVPDPDARELKIGKANYSRAGESLAFRWHDFALVLDDDLPADQRAEIAAVAQANAENAAFLRCLAAAAESKRAVSHNPGVNYYGSVFPKMAEGNQYGRAAYERAFERLLHLHEIELDAELWQGKNRHWKQGIRAAKKCATPPAPTPRADPRQPPSQAIDNTCANLRAPTPLYTTYMKGAPLGVAAPLPIEGDQQPAAASMILAPGETGDTIDLEAAQ